MKRIRETVKNAASLNRLAQSRLVNKVRKNNQKNLGLNTESLKGAEGDVTRAGQITSYENHSEHQRREFVQSRTACRHSFIVGARGVSSRKDSPRELALLLNVTTLVLSDYFYLIYGMVQKETKKPKPGTAPVRKKTTAGKAPEPMSFSLLNFRTQSLILALLGFIFYCNTFTHESAFDDRMAITDNDYVQKGIAGIPGILTTDAYQSYLEQKGGSNQLAGGRYRPLSLITFAIEQQFMGIADDADSNAKDARVAQQMPARHVINVLLYIFSCIVLLYFLRNIVLPGHPLVAFIAALLFTIHPVHTEVVANVKSRDEILSLLFICFTFIKAFRYKETLKRKELFYALLFFFLALLSKEYAVTLVILLPLSFYLFKNEPVGYTLRTALPYLIPLAVYLLLRFNAVKPAAEGAENNIMNNPYLYATAAQKLATEFLVLLNYLRLLIYPDPLIADYSYNQIPYTNFADPLVWLSLAIHIALIAAMVALFRKRHALCFAIAFYLFNLALVSNFFINIGAPMGERLIYHSSVGFCIATAWLLFMGSMKFIPAASSRRVLAGLMVVLVIASGYIAIMRNSDWKNDETLSLTDVKKAPNSVLLNNNAAAACMDNARRNKEDVAARNEWFAKAIGYFDKAISIDSMHYNAWLNRGLCYFDMGLPGKALQNWDTVRKYAPGQQNLGRYMQVAGKYFFAQGVKFMSARMPDSAVVAFGRSANADSAALHTWIELGEAHYILHQYTDAEKAAEKALRIAPDDSDAKHLYGKVMGVAAPL